MTNKATKYGLMTIAAVLLVAMAFAGAASAAYTYSSGSGTENDPYIIADAHDLYNLTQNVSDWQNPAGVYFKLGNDIYISDIQTIAKDSVTHVATISNSTESMEYNWDTKAFDKANWNPGFNESVASLGLSSWPSIGNITTEVTGKISLDGNNKKLYGLFINASSNHYGLFGSVNGSAFITIKDLTLEKAFVYTNVGSTSEGYIGALIGWARYSNHTLENCNLINSIVSTNGRTAGGLVGDGAYGTAKINECTVDDCIVSTKGNCAGGMFGDEEKSHGSIKKSSVSNTIIESKGFHSGGLFGSSENTLMIEDCTVNNCTVKAGDCNAAGIVGLLNRNTADDFYIVNCSVQNCNIQSGSKRCGGLIGAMNSNVAIRMCSVNDCYLTGGYDVGGMIGENAGYTCSFDSSSVTNCYLVTPYWVGGLIGKNCGPIERINSCSVKNCIISASNSGVGGLIGYVNSVDNTLNNVKTTTVENCTIIGGTSDIGGLVGYVPLPSKSDWSSWSGNTVANCAVKGKTNVSFDIGSYSGHGGCTVQTVYLNQTSLTSLQPIISVINNPGDVPDHAVIVTQLSGIGSPYTPYSALSYVIAVSDLVFNPTNGTGITYAGKVRVGDTTIDTFTTPVYKGHIFNGWNLISASGDMLTDDAGNLQAGVSGYTNGTNCWIYNSPEPVNLYANWTAEPAKKFTNISGTITLDPGYVVTKILVDGTAIENISFVYDQSVVASFPIGYHGTAFLDAFNITLVDGSFNGGTAKIFFNISKANLGELDTEKIVLAHLSNGIWEYLPTEIVSEDSEFVQFSAETTSFSPFYPMYMAANTYTVHFDANGGVGSMDDMTLTYDVGQNLTANAFQRYNSNFLYWTTADGTRYTDKQLVQNLTTVNGTTVEMKAQWEGYSTGGSSSGSTYMGSNSASYTPTQQPTVKPTVAPTAAPTEQPATPTVIATEKPTTQATQASPAPFVGLLAGLGAAAVLLRLRK